MSLAMEPENVLVVHADAFQQFVGVTITAEDMNLNEVLETVFTPDRLSMRPRATSEADRAFRQIIPYVIIMSEGQLLCYRRSAKGSENRLYGRRSVGWGGHINDADLKLRGSAIDVLPTIRASQRRELAEELGITEASDRKYLGLIIERDDDVGLVHVACVEVWTVSRNSDLSLEDKSENVEWQSLAGVWENLGELESWSLHALNLLKARGDSN